MKRAIGMILAVGAFVGALWLGWTFRANNSLSIDLDLIWIRIPNVELWWILLLAMALGASIVSIFFVFIDLRGRLLRRRQNKIIKKLEKEVHELRSLPLIGSEPTGEKLSATDGAPAAAAAAEINPTTDSARG